MKILPPKNILLNLRKLQFRLMNEYSPAKVQKLFGDYKKTY